MPIQFPNAPEPAISAMARLVQPTLAGSEIARARHSQYSLDGQPVILAAIANYMMDARDLVEGKSQRQARPIGWRFLWKNSAGELLSSNVTLRADGKMSSVPSVNLAGPFVASSAQLLKVLEKDESIRAVDFEARLLRFPSLGLFAYWLVAPSAADDLLIPISPVPEGVLASKRYRAEELFLILRPLASVILNGDTQVKR